MSLKKTVVLAGGLCSCHCLTFSKLLSLLDFFKICINLNLFWHLSSCDIGQFDHQWFIQSLKDAF